MKVCHFDIDIQMATTIPECYKDLDKLMYCAAGKLCLKVIFHLLINFV